MHIEVDMSGKIEQTNEDTVVVFRNDEQYSVLLKKKIKVEILTKYRNKYRDIHYRLFAILIYYCIRNYLSKVRSITIDIEYEGREEDIKRNLLRVIWKDAPDFDKKLIKFSRIGKHAKIKDFWCPENSKNFLGKSNAHRIAYQTFIGKLAPNKIITEKEVEKLI